MQGCITIHIHSGSRPFTASFHCSFPTQCCLSFFVWFVLICLTKHTEIKGGRGGGQMPFYSDTWRMNEWLCVCVCVCGGRADQRHCTTTKQLISLHDFLFQIFNIKNTNCSLSFFFFSFFDSLLNINREKSQASLSADIGGNLCFYL